MMISMERDAVDYSSKWVGAIYFLVAIYGSYWRNQDGVGTSIVPNQPQEISSP